MCLFVCFIPISIYRSVILVVVKSRIFLGSINMLFELMPMPLYMSVQSAWISWSILFFCVPQCLMGQSHEISIRSPSKINCWQHVQWDFGDIPFRLSVILWDPHRIELVRMEKSSDLQAFKAPPDPPLMPGGASGGLPGGARAKMTGTKTINHSDRVNNQQSTGGVYHDVSTLYLVIYIYIQVWVCVSMYKIIWYNFIW